MKKLIRLTESDLHNIIENTVRRVLKEGNVNEISYGVAKKTYDKMKSLGQSQRAAQLNQTFGSINNDDDASYSLYGDGSLHINDDQGNYNHGKTFYKDQEGNLYKDDDSTNDDIFDKVRTNDPKSAKNRARHASNFLGKSVDKNNFRK